MAIKPSHPPPGESPGQNALRLGVGNPSKYIIRRDTKDAGTYPDVYRVRFKG